ncbi:hypothetical protein FOZ63_010629, partial [Perkinsus olseni]
MSTRSGWRHDRARKTRFEFRFWGNSDVGPFSGEKGRIHYTPCDHDDLLWRKKVAATLFPFKEGPHTVCLRDVSDTEPEIVYAQANAQSGPLPASSQWVLRGAASAVFSESWK